jgi:hypothetical protein
MHFAQTYDAYKNEKYCYQSLKDRAAGIESKSKQQMGRK